MAQKSRQTYSENVLDAKSSKQPKRGREETLATIGSPAEISSMPPDRAFVVQFRTPAEPGADWSTGRAEHLMSGQNLDFETPAELFAFFGRVLNPPYLRSQRRTKQ